MNRNAAEFLTGGGAMGGLVRAHAWEGTPLGPLSAWPPSLRTLSGVCLNSGFPMCLFWGPEYVQIYNDGFAPILGKRHPAALGVPARSTWSEIWEFVEPRFRQVHESGQAVGAVDQMLRTERNGYDEETYFTFSYSPILESDAGVSGILNVVTETTGAVLGERRMRLLRNLAMEAAQVRTRAQIPECLRRALPAPHPDLPFVLQYVHDPVGTLRLEAVSGGVSAGKGFPESIVLGRTEEASAFAKLLNGAFSGEEPRLIEDPDGTWNVPALPGCAPVRLAVVTPLPEMEGGRRPGLLVMGVNPHRALDEDYRGFLGLFAGHVATAYRNAMAFEAERARAEALAELDRSKSAFFSNVSHELRTPLTLLLGPLESALAADPGLLPLSQRTGLEMAHRNAKRLLMLVNDLLDFSRVEAGRAQVSRVATDLGVFTADLAGMFRSLCEAGGLRLDVECPPSSRPVSVDREHWEKIVLNLVSNAFKFTFAGGIRVRLVEEDEAVRLEVEDTGVGIDPGELPKIFDRFHRVEGARARTYEGSGIGLALVSDLVRLNGGGVEVRSEPGVGSTFTVRIPREPTGAGGGGGAGADPVTQAVPTRKAGSFFQEVSQWLPRGAGRNPAVEPAVGATVLVVDDNADMRDYLVRLLERHWRVLAASNGEEALRISRRDPPDLVLSDVMMPGLDGLAFVKELRADPSMRHLPVILVSARAGMEASVEGLGAGADDYLIKPFSPPELVARVKSRLDLARTRKEAAQTLLESQLQLQHSQKLEAIGRLAGGIAHDFNNLLTGINGFADLGLAMIAADNPARECMEEIQKAGRRAAGLTGQLLAFGRKQAVDPRSLDLPAIVLDMGNLLRRCVPESVRFRQEMGEGSRIIRCDKTQAEQVLMNLVTNAADSMPRGGSVTVAVRPAELDARQGGFQLQAPPGRYIQLAVEDDGRGMGPEIMAHLFEPFFTTKGKGRGNGLGLATVYAIMKQNGGAIRVTSDPGQGTAFHLYFPRVEAEDPPSAPIATAAHGPGRGELVLLVEDEATVRSFAVACLRKAGYRVWEAANGADAIRQHGERIQEVDLLLTDVIMPIMGGREFAEWFLARRTSGRVLFMSGYMEDCELLRGIQESQAHFLPKPFTSPDLEAKLRQVICEASVPDFR